MLQYTTQIQTKNSNLRNSIGPKPGFFNNNKNISKKLIEREQGGERAERERSMEWKKICRLMQMVTAAMKLKDASSLEGKL